LTFLPSTPDAELGLLASFQFIFTIPKRLRVFFKYKRRLLGELCRSALQALRRYFKVVAGISSGQRSPGRIFFMTFSRALELRMNAAASGASHGFRVARPCAQVVIDPS
jgi:hypothetical protein